EWAPRFDSLVLTRISDQQHAVVRSKARKKLVHLVRRSEARFIDKVKVLLLRGCRNGWPHKESLQRSGRDASLAKLARGSRGWSKPFDLIPLRLRSVADDRKCRGFPRSGETLKALNAISGTQNILDHAPLSAVQVLMPIGN